MVMLAYFTLIICTYDWNYLLKVPLWLSPQNTEDALTDVNWGMMLCCRLQRKELTSLQSLVLYVCTSVLKSKEKKKLPPIICSTPVSMKISSTTFVNRLVDKSNCHVPRALVWCHCWANNWLLLHELWDVFGLKNFFSWVFHFTASVYFSITLGYSCNNSFYMLFISDAQLCLDSIHRLFDSVSDFIGPLTLNISI